MIINEELYLFISAHYQILVIIVFCLTGSIIKDIYNTIIDKDSKVKLTRILVSSITACILSYSFTDPLIKMGVTSKTLVTVYFISGLVGFNLLEKLTSVEGVGDFLNYIKEYFYKK